MLMGTGSPGGSPIAGALLILAALHRRVAGPSGSVAARRGNRRFPNLRLPQHVERRRQVQRFAIPLGGSGVRTRAVVEPAQRN